MEIELDFVLNQIGFKFVLKMIEIESFLKIQKNQSQEWIWKFHQEPKINEKKKLEPIQTEDAFWNQEPNNTNPNQCCMGLCIFLNIL